MVDPNLPRPTEILWHCASHTLRLDRRPLLMGIVNVTPDSFSDHHQAKEAIIHAEHLLRDGADLLDIGGESTRPGAQSVALEEEWRRVHPVIQDLASFGVPLSIDTQKEALARAALDAGVHIVNHVSATLHGSLFTRLLSEFRCGYIAMHMKAPPAIMQHKAQYEEVVTEVRTALERLGADLCQEGFIGSAARGSAAQSPSLSSSWHTHLVYDPGIGFGKTLEQNVTLMQHLPSLARDLGRPLLLGVSRKRWLGELLQLDLEARDPATACASALFPFPAVAIQRVHNVKATREALILKSALYGLGWNFDRSP
jgi:dihydropteroate synthase